MAEVFRWHLGESPAAIGVASVHALKTAASCPGLGLVQFLWTWAPHSEHASSVNRSGGIQPAVEVCPQAEALAGPLRLLPLTSLAPSESSQAPRALGATCCFSPGPTALSVSRGFYRKPHRGFLRMFCSCCCWRDLAVAPGDLAGGPWWPGQNREAIQVPVSGIRERDCYQLLPFCSLVTVYTGASTTGHP